jgi:hypothetical protein
MKTQMIASLILLALCGACSSSQPSSTANQATEISSDGYTWKLGAIVMDGTNVPASQVRVSAIHSTNAPATKSDTVK